MLNFNCSFMIKHVCWGSVCTALSCSIWSHSSSTRAESIAAGASGMCFSLPTWPNVRHPPTESSQQVRPPSCGKVKLPGVSSVWRQVWVIARAAARHAKHFVCSHSVCLSQRVCVSVCLSVCVCVCLWAIDFLCLCVCWRRRRSNSQSPAPVSHSFSLDSVWRHLDNTATHSEVWVCVCSADSTCVCVCVSVCECMSLYLKAHVSVWPLEFPRSVTHCCFTIDPHTPFNCMVCVCVCACVCVHACVCCLCVRGD